MNEFEGIKWEDFVSTNIKWVDKFFHHLPGAQEFKVRTRVLSLKFSGTQQESLALSSYLANSIKNYIFDKAQIKKMQDDDEDPFRKASAFFGATDPVKDGKYGELMLYLLVEAVLKVPMVSHKLQLLTNLNDQVKGGDGIFFGKYGGNLSIFIGEAKIHQAFTQATVSSLKSIDRFHQNYTASSLSHELFIARSNISQNFTIEQYEKMYEAFTPGSACYQDCIKVHPVLLVYDSKKISDIEDAATGKEHAEQLVAEWLKDYGQNALDHVQEKLGSYPKLKKVYLDFFLVPMSDVGSFKKTLYKEIHGIEFKDPPPEKKKAASAKSPKSK
ncbi:hypothetical protein B6S59_01180 [Pseudomonas sp. A46]|nr:Hachiman antiphage defense system protein HamA [Pseudomonas sp. A46]OWJ98219.1 hypothetical protein B6S59_01180 [Pseudomonas sp. A46]